MGSREDKVINIYMEKPETDFLKENEVSVYGMPRLEAEYIRKLNEAYRKISRFSADTMGFVNTFYRMVYAQPFPEEKLFLHLRKQILRN